MSCKRCSRIIICREKESSSSSCDKSNSCAKRGKRGKQGIQGNVGPTGPQAQIPDPLIVNNLVVNDSALFGGSGLAFTSGGSFLNYYKETSESHTFRWGAINGSTRVDISRINNTVNVFVHSISFTAGSPTTAVPTSLVAINSAYWPGETAFAYSSCDVDGSSEIVLVGVMSTIGIIRMYAGVFGISITGTAIGPRAISFSYSVLPP